MRSAAIVLACLLAAPMTVAGAPTVTIQTDRDTYSLGGTIELSISGSNPEEDMPVDVYVGLLHDDLRTYFLSDEGWSSTRTDLGQPIPIEPWRRGLFLPSGFAMQPVVFERIDLPATMPTIGQRGKYYFVSVLTLSGAEEWLSSPSVAPIILETPPSREMRMLPIPAGSFEMGSPEAEQGHEAPEGPQHHVNISAFLMAETEITQAQWKKTLGFNPSIDRSHDDLPVEYITWFDCVAFCDELSVAEGLTPCYTIENIIYYDPHHIRSADVTCDFEAEGYRLPTEAEWEYACRAGTTTAYHSGDSEADLLGVGWCLENGSGKTHPVALKEPNAWGLYDMHGNIGEICWDYCDFDFYSSSPDTNPTGPASGDGRVRRGGSWWDVASICRCAYRKFCFIGCLCDKTGLRVVRSATGAAGPTVAIHTDKTTYSLDDQIKLSLSGFNYGEGVEVDVFVGFIDSIGQTLMLTPNGWSYTYTLLGEHIPLVPLFSSISLPSGLAVDPFPFEWLDLPCRMPPIGVQDHYYFLAALSHAGTFEWIGQASYAEFFLEPGPGAPIDMLSVPAGSFIMGSPESEEGHQAAESPQHEVSISAFMMSRTEITQRQWFDAMGFSTNYNRYSQELPAEGFNWFDSLVFCNALSDSEGLEPCYTLENIQRFNARHIGSADVTCDFAANGYRLPTEAEWEYACRAGGTTRFHSGDSADDLGRVGWYRGNADLETYPVAQKEPNAWGFYDMHGNVGEFCWDFYDETYYARSPSSDPRGAETGERKARRGGSWFDWEDTSRCAFRKDCGLNCWCDASGIRVVRSMPDRERSWTR